MRYLTALLALAALALPAAAGADELTDLRAAQERWAAAGIDDYSFTVAYGCFCPSNITKPARVKVRNGKAIDPPKRVRSASTVEKLFGIIQGALDGDAARVTVSYGRYGMPRNIYIDQSEQIADEERSFTARKLRPKG